MSNNEYEIVVRQIHVQHRPVFIYEAIVFRVESRDGVKISHLLGAPDVSVHDSPNKEKVIDAAMALIRSEIERRENED